MLVTNSLSWISVRSFPCHGPVLEPPTCICYSRLPHAEHALRRQTSTDTAERSSTPSVAQQQRAELEPGSREVTAKQLHQIHKKDMAAPNPGPWQGLPLELQRRIMLESFLINFGNTEDFRFTPKEPQPDLGFVRVPNRLLRKQFDTVILPDTVLIEIECRTCLTCYMRNPQSDARIQSNFTSDRPASWDYLRKRASNVKIVVRCDEPILRTFRVHTLYVPGNKLNILRLSQTFLGPMRWHQPIPFLQQQHGDKIINVNCYPKSKLGAEHTAELLDLLADLLHGMRTTRKSIRQVVSPGLRAILTTAIRRAYPQHTTWRAVNPVHKKLLEESQILLDMPTFHPHHLAETAAFAYMDFNSRDDPSTNATVPQLPQHQMEEFTYREINGNCLMFVAFHGLADYMLRRHNDPQVIMPNQYRHEIMNARRRFSTLRNHVVRRKWTVWNNLSQQRAALFRAWRASDATFLVHHAAMLQTYLRFEIIILVQDWFIGGQDRVNILQHYGVDIVGICRVWLGHLRPLRRLDRYITALRANTAGDNPLYEGYDTYEIPAFIAGMQRLLADLSVNTWNMTDDQFFATLDLSFFSLPARLRIPTIAPADWASVRTTFDDVNNVSLWHA